ncbi:MAG: deoxynucleoside kinase [Candidatus Thiodiazotropha sp. (ex Epidulcina cf. delphinae)]|nr:deoxynucleoside kinase [Candidatus Thiodiazotropha sp. (ex Epidulcina cf. delphinae)]
MHAEFLGLPGVGKTTLRSDLVKNLKRIDEGVYLSFEDAFHSVSKLKMDRAFRLPLNLLPNSLSKRLCKKFVNRSLMQFDAQNEFIANSVDIIKAFISSTAFENMPEEDRKVMIASILELGSIWTSIGSLQTTGSLIIFEEGFVQKSFMFVNTELGSDIDYEHIKLYMKNIPFPELLIYINADIDTCYHRMLSRPGGLTSRLRNANSDIIRDFLNRLEQHVLYIVDYLSKNSHCELITVNNSGDYKETLGMLTEKIAKSVAKKI